MPQNPKKRKRGKKVFATYIFCSCFVLFLIVLIVVGTYVYKFLQEQKKAADKNQISPIVAFTYPTGDEWFATEDSMIGLKGMAWDDEAVSRITWRYGSGEERNITVKENWEIDEIFLYEGDNEIYVSAYDSDGNKGEAKIDIVHNERVNFFNEPKVTPEHIYKGDPPQEITISLGVVTDYDEDIAEVVLYEVNENGEIIEPVGEMSDSGIDEFGDEVPSDKIYSFKTLFSSDRNLPIYLRVVAKHDTWESFGKSVVFKIDVIERVSNSQFEDIMEINEKIIRKRDDLARKEFSEAEFANELMKYVSRLSGISDYGISEQGYGVWWIYEQNCIPGGIFLYDDNSKSSTISNSRSNSSELSIPSKGNVLGVSDSIPRFPGYSLYLGVFNDEFAQFDEYAGAWKQRSAYSCLMCESREKFDQEVQISDFMSLDEYGLVLISSHGDNWFGKHSEGERCADVLTESQPVLLTKEIVTEENFKNYLPDLELQRLAISADGYYVVLPEFISHYNKNFANSLIYASSCRSAYNPLLAKTFISKKADSFFGYSDYVNVNEAYTQGKDLFINLFGDDQPYSEAVKNIEQAESSSLLFYKNTTTGYRNSIFNDSFDEEGLVGWRENGDVYVIPALAEIKPTAGEYMALLGTGLVDEGNNQASIGQCMCNKFGHTTIKFDYNIVSEEPEEYINSSFDDRFTVTLTIDGQPKIVLDKGISDSTWKELLNVNFQGGDDTTYQTGWITHEIRLDQEDIKNAVEITFAIESVGGSGYDTVVLLDNIRTL